METENVKERLNTLLHKKMIEQERECKNPSPPEQSVFVKQEVDRDKICNGVAELAENSTENIECGTKEQFTESFLLHDILNEKKKALLQDKDVINFFQNKLKST